MNIRKYEAYVRAVELGSLSKAAEQLGYTQSGMSHMMQSLEEEVGFPLMVRTSTGILPNSEGELLLPIIRQLLNTNESLEQHIAKIKGADTALPRIPVWQPTGFRKSSAISKKTIPTWRFRSPRWGPAPSRRLWQTARRSFASTQAGRERTLNGCRCAGTGCWCWCRRTIR